MLDLEHLRGQAKLDNLDPTLLECLRERLEWYRITVCQLCAEVERLRQACGQGEVKAT